MCRFDEAWIGVCKADGEPYCEKHLISCVSCGEQATHSCDATGQFCCGQPLCDNCEHTYRSNGCSGGLSFYEPATLPEGLKEHCKKSEQVYLMWMYKDILDNDEYKIIEETDEFVTLEWKTQPLKLSRKQWDTYKNQEVGSGI